MTTPADQIRNDTDQRLMREISKALEERQEAYARIRAEFIATEAAKAYEQFFASLKARFEAEAAERFAADNPPWTFEREAELRLQRQAPQPQHRADLIARLAALHEAGK
jgi:hypothetical protein